MSITVTTSRMDRRYLMGKTTEELCQLIDQILDVNEKKVRAAYEHAWKAGALECPYPMEQGFAEFEKDWNS